MLATLSEKDRVILRYEVPAFDGTRRNVSGSELLIVEDSETSSLAVLWRTAHYPEDKNTYTVSWKGDMNSCLNYVTSEIADFEHDFALETGQN